MSTASIGDAGNKSKPIINRYKIFFMTALLWEVVYLQLTLLPTTADLRATRATGEQTHAENDRKHFAS
jgi:hypothetical protein